MIRSHERYHYVTDKFGGLWRVDSLTGQCNAWVGWMWLRRVSYHDVSLGFAPLVPAIGCRTAEQCEAWRGGDR